MGQAMPIRPSLVMLAGALAVAVIAIVGAERFAPDMAADLSAKAQAAIAEQGGNGITAEFHSANGFASRHPLLKGGENLNEGIRDKVAKAVAAIPGVGGIRWADGSMRAQDATVPITPLHCQEEVEALLRARTIRFEESSSRIDAASAELLDEVATALRPCLGSIIAITGHTDSSGPEPGNLSLSQERADAVEQALVSRGIPSDGLRARGIGSSNPVEGLDPADPANRRIEFSVIATVPLQPTPVDTPGPR